VNAQNVTKIDYNPFGGIPYSCRETCYSDLFPEDVEEPDGHKSQRLKRACHAANHYDFDAKKNYISGRSGLKVEPK
jgi:hypothetical protein